MGRLRCFDAPGENGGISMTKRYLVTGGCGFIGSHLVDSLLADGHEIVVLDNLSSGRRENLDARAKLILGCITDPEAVARAMAGVNGCFHLAAIASPSKSIEDWVGTHRTNQTGTICILDNAAKLPGRPAIPVIYASSAAVYGNTADTPITESSQVQPLTAYGADKAGSELHAAVVWHTHSLPTVGLRFFNVYGPRQDPSSPYSGVISIFVDRAKQGQPITIYGDGRQVRDFIHVTDVVAHLKKALAYCERDASVFNVCTGHPTEIGQLAKLIGELLGRSPRIAHAPSRLGDIYSSIGSPRQAVEVLGVRSSIDLPSGLRALVNDSILST